MDHTFKLVFPVDVVGTSHAYGDRGWIQLADQNHRIICAVPPGEDALARQIVDKLNDDGERKVVSVTMAITSDQKVQFQLYDSELIGWKEIWEKAIKDTPQATGLTQEVYEPDVTHAISHFVKPGAHVIDAGANFGYFSLLLSKLVGDEGEVLAFEPDPNHYLKLSDNIVLNHSDNVTAMPVALWADQDFKVFCLIKEGGYSSFIPYVSSKVGTVIGSRKLLTHALDDIVPDYWLPVNFMKLDCEGAEEAILLGAQKILQCGVDCVVTEFNYNIMPIFGTSDVSVRQYMHDLDYDFFLLKKNGETPFYVPPGFDLSLLAEHKAIVNVMFSTRDKVAACWGVCPEIISIEDQADPDTSLVVEVADVNAA